MFPGSPPDGWTASESLTAVANEEVTLNFTSGDFVYTVLQYEHEVAKVILPGKSACSVSVQLLPGVWEFKLAAGCGGRSPGHKKILYIEAVDRP